MPGIRSVLVGLSPLLADIVRRVIAPRVPLRIIVVIGSRTRLLRRLRLLAPALVLIGLEPGEDDAIAAYLAAALDGVRVLALAADARHAAMHEAGQPTLLMPDPSPDQLIDAIRKV